MRRSGRSGSRLSAVIWAELKIYGRADVPVQSLLDVRLRALRDDKPFKRHTSVLDWPLGSDANETKELWKQICLELSEDLRISLALPVTPVVRP